VIECLQCPLAECNEKDPRCLIRPKRKENVNYFRRIAKATDEEIIALYQSGMSSDKVAEARGVSPRCVRNVLNYNGVEKAPRPKKIVAKPDRVLKRGRPRKRDERFISFLVSVIVCGG
jgi:hypothetical protein